MKASEIKKLVQPEGQSNTTFNAFKRFLKEVDNLTNEQISQIHYESWYTAYTRAAKIEESKQ